MSFKRAKIQTRTQKRKPLLSRRLIMGTVSPILCLSFSACSLSTNNNQPVASKMPLPTSLKPATSQQKQVMLDYAVQLQMALDVVKQSSPELAEVFSDIKNYAGPSTPLSPTTDYTKALTLANENCTIRKTMESPTNARLKANKSSQWSANLDPDLKACGYNFLDVTESTESSVPDQGTLSTSGRSLHFDLSGVKEKLSQNDISEVQYGVGTKTYELSINSQRGFKRDSRQMTQRSKVVYSTLTLANGIQVKIDLSETLITEKLYVDDTLSIPVGSRTLTFLAHLPVGDLGYEKKIQYLDNGKSNSRIELNGEVILQK